MRSNVLRIVALSALLSIFGIPLNAQVVFDAASNMAAPTASTATSIVTTWNHTVGTAKKPYVIVSVSLKLNGGGATVGNILYGVENGGPFAPMTFLGAATNGTTTRAELWGLPNPLPGAHTIQVTVNNAGAQNVVVVAGAKSFSNVFQSAATAGLVTNTGNTTTPTVTVTNSPTTAVVDAVAFNSNNALVAGAGQTNAFNLTSSGPNPLFSGGGSMETGTTNSTMSWTAGAVSTWAIAAVPLQPSSPQILFDSVAGTTFSSNALSFSGNWNHTTTNAANRYLVVGVDVDEANSANLYTVTNLVYGTEGGGPNQALTRIGFRANGNNVRAELWGLAAPATGTHQITATITAPAGARATSVVAESQTFSGIEQQAPIGTFAQNSANNNTPNVVVANSPYDYVVDTVAYNSNQTLTISGAQQDQRYAALVAAGGTATNFAGSSSGAHGYTNVTMSWTATGGGATWAMGAIPLKLATVGLTITSSADVIKLGQSITYTVTATNYGAASATTTTITIPLPAGTTFVSQTGCAGTGPVTCTVGTLAAGATSASYTMTVTPNSAGNITNNASVVFNGNATPNFTETVNTLVEGQVCATPGKDGAGGTLAGIRNDYWPGTSTFASGATSITVGGRVAGGAGNAIAAGDLLILMQMQDAAFDTTNDETYGEGSGSTRGTGTGSGAATTLNNAGRWEYVIAAGALGAGGGALTIAGGGVGGGTLYGYTSQTFATTTTQGQRTWQLIRVPQYTTATLGSTLTALAWNGSTGGVLAIDVSGTLSLGGATVSVNGLGFRGGAGRVLGGDATGGLANTDYRTSATLATNGSKAEGIVGTPRYIYQSGATIGAPGANAALDTGVEGLVGGSYGRGAPGNSGGGSTDGDPPGNDQNSGGGGGGNGGSGGAGGFSWNIGLATGGQGGAGISPSLTRITMGGGGGAGTTNNGSAADAAGNVLADNTAAANGYYSSGSNGGGVIIVRALQATGTATVTSNGFNAANVGRDGGGGGGAGGSILFTTQSGTLTGLTLQAKGGKGGSAWLLQAAGSNGPGAGNNRHGPGGGGGGGYILLSSAAASTDVGAGANGVTTLANDSFGALPGTPGIVQFIAGNNVLPGGDGASCAVADLATTNTTSAIPVSILQNITFTQTVVNNGTSPADSVVFTQTIPAGAIYQSMTVPAGWTCITPAVGGTGDITCTRPTLTPANGVQNFSVVVQANGGTPSGYLIVDTCTVSSATADSNPANNTATAQEPVVWGTQSDVSVTLTNNATTATTAGSNVTFTSVAQNVGVSAATGTTWSMAIPPNMSYQSIGVPAGWTCITPAVNATAPGSINCSFSGSFAAGASSTFTPVFKVLAGTAAGTTITGTADVAATNDNDTSNNSASSSFLVRGAAGYDMAATMAVSANPVAPAQNLTFTSVVTNNGPASAPATGAGVQWVMNVPANTNFQSMGTFPAGWVCVTPAVGASAGTITCTYQVAGVNQAFTTATTSTFQPVFQVNAATVAGTTITGSAVVNINGTTAADNVPANNTASAPTLVTSATNADVAIVKRVSPNPVGQGQLVNYTLAVTNNGPATATNVTISDPLPASLQFSSVSSNVSCTGGATISCTIASIPVDTTSVITFIAQATTAGTINNTATRTGADQTDPVAANDSSTAPLTVFAVTFVRLRKTNAIQDKDKVLVTWETSFESDNLGFNLYRDVSGVRTQINKKLIAGSALVTKKNTPNASHAYRFRDKVPANTYPQYWLEDVDLNGTKTMHGPIVPGVGTIPDGDDSPALSGLGLSGSVLQSPVGVGVVHPLALPQPTDKQTKAQLDLASGNALKIFVSQEGWYRVTYAQMTAAGFDPGKNEKQLSLYTSGVELPIVADSDGIEFYGLPLDTVSTGARTYWLRSGKGNGNRINVAKNNGGNPITEPLSFTYDRKERTVFFTALTNNGDATNFFGQIISTWGPANEELVVGALDPSYGGNATLDITIQGGSDQTHHGVDLAINGRNIGQVALDNQEQKTFTIAFPQSFLVGGSNTLTMNALNGDNDVTVVAEAKLTYQHLLKADGGELEIVIPGQRAITIGGFTATSRVRAMDITDPQNPSELATTMSADGSATFTATDAGSRTVLVFDSTRVLTAPELVANHPSSWSDGKSGASLLIITNSKFSAAAASLASARQRDGISATVIDVDDVYDEANFGVRDPQAIRSFLKSATQWKTAPKWVIFLGDASFDPRNYYELGTYDYVPTFMVPTLYMKTASDDALTDFDGDGIADIPVGRIPARTAADASLVVNRIGSRGTPSGTWSNNALFIAEPASDFDFPAAARDAASKLPASLSSRVIASGVTPAMNDGALLVGFVGHGSVELWGEPTLFTSSEASALTNGNRLPFVVAMTCLTGFFHDLYTTSIAEALLEAPNGGAIAVWGSSTLTEPDQQALMNNELMRQLFTPGITIGEAARRAKMVTSDRDVRTSWILFGDPSMKMK